MTTIMATISLHVPQKKFNRNIYIPRIIQAGLCYTMPFHIPSCSSADDAVATESNSQDKDYQVNPGFRKKSDLLLMRMIYEHQQKQHIKLMSALESFSKKKKN